MSNDGIKLDGDGYIDTAQFQKELHSALDSDIKYRQTDYMKKRAVKVAKSYDEFKEMVACAHLKTVNRKEVEELSASKKGWKKSHTSNSSSLLNNSETVFTSLPVKTSSGELPKPKSMMELVRDWRRLNEISLKIEYLTAVGRSKFKKLIENMDDCEIFEDILDVILQSFRNSLVTESDKPLPKLESHKSWLKSLNSCKNYDMFIGSVNQSVKDEVSSILSMKPKKIPKPTDEAEGDGEMIAAQAIRAVNTIDLDSIDD